MFFSLLNFPCRITWVTWGWTFNKKTHWTPWLDSPRQFDWIPKDAEIIVEFQGNQLDCWDGLGYVRRWVDISVNMCNLGTRALNISKMSNLRYASTNWCISRYIKHMKACFFYRKNPLLIDNKCAVNCGPNTWGTAFELWSWTSISTLFGRLVFFGCWLEEIHALRTCFFYGSL